MLFFYELNDFVSRNDDDVSIDNDERLEELNIIEKDGVISKAQTLQDDPKDKETKELPNAWSYGKQHPNELIISGNSKGVTIRSSLHHISNCAFISQIIPKNINEALNDEYWVSSLQAELTQFERNNV